jgi:hypothetical protein
VVRPPRAAGLRARRQLRRFVDGVGQPRGRADRAGLVPKAPLAAPALEDVRALPVRPS